MYLAKEDRAGYLANSVLARVSPGSSVPSSGYHRLVCGCGISWSYSLDVGLFAVVGVVVGGGGGGFFVQTFKPQHHFQQCCILTSVVSDEPVQTTFRLRNSKWCSVYSLTVIEYPSD